MEQEEHDNEMVIQIHELPEPVKVEGGEYSERRREGRQRLEKANQGISNNHSFLLR